MNLMLQSKNFRENDNNILDDKLKGDGVLYDIF